MPTGYAVTSVAALVAVVACVVIHYEGLRFLTGMVQRGKHNHRRRIIVLILSLLLMHIVEIWLFGGTYFLLLSYADVGELRGLPALNLFDSVYYSSMVYTTIGFGDIVPVGAIRLLTGMEGVTGLVMITWSASYTFLVMLKTWNLND